MFKSELRSELIVTEETVLKRVVRSFGHDYLQLYTPCMQNPDGPFLLLSALKDRL